MEKLTRRNLLKGSSAIALASVLPMSEVFAKSIKNGIDRLVDDKGNFVLLPLPYKEDFLEPYLDAETVHLHYTYHHGGAVKGANKDLKMIKKALEKNDFSTVDYWTKKLQYHFSSHVLHTIYWTNLTNKKTEPKGELLKRIEKQFGSVDKLKSLLYKISKSVMGSGWGVLAYQPFADSLVVLQVENHERLTQWGAIPLLALDVWEHSYYLKYQNRRGEYLKQIMKIINWDDVRRRLEIAKRLV